MKNGHILTKSRGVTLMALALTLGAAVYLNWSLGRTAPVVAQDSALSTEPAGGVVETAANAGEPDTAAVFDPLVTVQEAATATAAPQQSAQETANKNYGEAQLVSVNKDSGTEFFDAARLARSKARDEALETIQKTLKSTTLSAEEKEQLTTNLSAQVNNVTLETSLETLIKAKGFADCVVSIDGKRANVTVMTENDILSGPEVAKIRDALLSQCHGMSAQDITIVEVK